MNHNPHNFKIGDIVMLDNNHRNRYEVKIVYMALNNLICTVEYKNNKWDIMTYRLTPIKTSTSH